MLKSDDKTRFVNKTNAEFSLLLVDDEDNIRRAVQRVLRREGYVILQAASGAQGLELLEANPAIGVILSDQRMPEMTGIEFLSQARKIRPDTVRMVLSGYTDLTTVTDAINQGEIYKFLIKPWEDELLRANVKDAFEHYKLRFENERLTQELRQINAKLERRVEQKTRDALMSVHALQISQQVLEQLPLEVVGIDEHGLVVVVNHLASLRLASGAHNLLGQLADDVMPKEIMAQVERCFSCEGNENEITTQSVDIRLANTTLQVHCTRLGHNSLAQGVIVVMVPKNEN